MIVDFNDREEYYRNVGDGFGQYIVITNMSEVVYSLYGNFKRNYCNKHRILIGSGGWGGDS